jgi:hypothetical protein
MKKTALCQGCLRIWEVVDLLPSEDNPPGLCPVCVNDRKDGQTCDCEGCMHTARLLAAGDIAEASRGMRPGLTLIAWSPECGGVATGTPTW